MNGCFPSRAEACRIAAALALTALLAACATPRGAQLPALGDWDVRRQVLGDLDQWEFSGRIAVKTESDGFNGKLRWAQHEEAFSATASGPLNAGAVRIEGDGRSVVLTDKKGERSELLDAEIEFRLRYGWSIPITSLRYWALGIPDPDVPADTVVDPSGLLSSLRQRDWSVSYARYADGGGQLMPKVLTAENDDTRVRLVIDYWIF